MTAPVRGDLELVDRLRRGDEDAFRTVVHRHHASLVRVARLHVSSDAVAEEVAQETWLAVLAGIDRFEGRSSLKTWLFRILVNRARTRGVREHRSIPFSSLARREVEASDPAADPGQFLGPDAEWPGHWGTPPSAWPDPAEIVTGDETQRIVEETIKELPPAQRTVITLRDVEGFDSEEVCELMDITAVNQRVLLHRARAKVRTALDAYFDEARAEERHRNEVGR